jgi:hypothetical protein
MSSFDELAEFRDIVEAQMQEVKHLDRARIIEEFKLFEPKDHDEEQLIWAEQNSELEVLDRKFAVTYPRISRYSFLTMLFMHIETNLKAVCVEIAKRKKLKYRASEFRGTIFDQAKLFLVKEASLPPFAPAAWGSLTNLQKIRNCIVHCRGRVADSRDRAEIESLTTNNLGLSITPPMFHGLTENDSFVDADEGLLQIEPVFCTTILKGIKSLFGQIFEKAGCFGPDHVVRVD